MSSSALNLAAWSYGVAALIYALVAIRVAVSSRSGLRGIALNVALVVTAAWAAAGWCVAQFHWPWLVVTTGFIDVLRATAWQVFLLLMLRAHQTVGERDAADRLWPVSAVLVGTTFIAYAMLGTGFSAFGDAARLALFGTLALTIFVPVLVEQLWRNTPDELRWGIKPLCIGLVAVGAFDLYYFADALLFSRYDPDVWVARGFVHTIAIPLIAMSAFRIRTDTFQVRVSRRVVFHTAALVASGAYLLFMAGAGYYVRFFGGDWGRSLQVALTFAAVLSLGVLLASRSMRAKLRVLVAKHFFSYRYDYREEWLHFTQALVRSSGQSEPGVAVIRALADLVESPGGALWVGDSSGRGFSQLSRWNMARSAVEEPTDGALSGFLRESGWVVNLEEYRSSPMRYRDLALPVWLQEIPEAWLVVPLAIGDELLGFVILATARTEIDVNWEVNDLLKTAARQAASFLGQMRATDALLEARKFDAFNRMSAFVVHDLKNIISQLSLMLKNAQRHRANPEFQRDMLETVEHSVEKMKQLMMQLREGTTPVNAPQGVDIVQIAERIRQAKQKQSRLVTVEAPEVAYVRGHEDRLERVIGHLVQNALDATDREGRVWIRLERAGGQVLVEVGDTGHGMTAEFVRDRLFKPFQTTKQTGMGIGAYESFQYLRELGGSVAVDSAPGQGTRVRLSLPGFDSTATAAEGNPAVVDGKAAA